MVIRFLQQTDEDLFQRKSLSSNAAEGLLEELFGVELHFDKFVSFSASWVPRPLQDGPLSGFSQQRVATFDVH
jgi:hypothetical protein